MMRQCDKCGTVLLAWLGECPCSMFADVVPLISKEDWGNTDRRELFTDWFAPIERWIEDKYKEGE